MEKTQQENQPLQGQEIIWRCIYAFVDTMALKCAVQLGIADIINSHGNPISLTQIATSINHPTLVPDRLSRVMALLVRRGIFSANLSSEGDKSDTLYGLTEASKWLLRDSEKSLAKMLLSQSNPLDMSAWQHLEDCVKEGCTGFMKCYGMEGWEVMSSNPESCTLLLESLGGLSKIVAEAVKEVYRGNGGLDGVDVLVDAGGGNGALVAEIVREFPHIKGINFDLPHAIAKAPNYVGVSHVAGDILTSIPRGHAILMKMVMHNWDDNRCIKILENCRKAIPEEGKIIIIDVVMEPAGQDLFHDTGVALDLLMMVCHGAKERSEAEWKKLLEGGGFPRYKIIKIPALLSIIEAYPKI